MFIILSCFLWTLNFNLLDSELLNQKLYLLIGMYYDFDSGSPNSKSIMADQLCGIWYLQACGIIDEVCCHQK